MSCAKKLSEACPIKLGAIDTALADLPLKLTYCAELSMVWTAAIG